MTAENAQRPAAELDDPTCENTQPAAADAVLGAYARHLARPPLEASSARTYVSAARGYLAWLGTADVDGDPLREQAARDWAMRDYRSYLTTVLKRSPATVVKLLAALDNFYTWLGLGPAEHVGRPDIPRRAPRALDPRAAKRYLRAVQACPSVRDRAVALTPFYAGTRISEVSRLDLDDVRLSARKGELRLLGKRQKIRTIGVDPVLREALTAWLLERPRWPGAAGPACFLSRQGRRLSTSAINDVIHAITRAGGLDDDVTAHVLRHTFGTTLVRGGIDLVMVAEMMGHSRLETTRGYTLPTADDMDAALALLPRDT